jgi:sulfur carrier protein
VRVTVNGEEQHLADGSTVADLIGDRARGVAVAVNDEVVPRGLWSVTALHDGDRVEVLEPQQGG